MNGFHFIFHLVIGYGEGTGRGFWEQSQRLTFVFGLKRFALLTPTDCTYLKVVFLRGVKVLDEQPRLLLRDLELRLLPTCSQAGEEETFRDDITHTDR